MNKIILSFFTILFALAVVSCARKEFVVKDTDVSYAKDRWHDENPAMLARGKEYYSTYCQKCHGLKNPSRYSEAEWKDIMPSMQKKAHLPDSMADVIFKYVITARNGMKAGK